MHPSSCNYWMNCDCNKTYVRLLLLWVVTQCMLVVVYRCYCRVQPSSPLFVILKHDCLTYFPWEPFTAHTIPNITTLTPVSSITLGLLGPLKMESIGCPKTLGNNYRYMLCNSAEEWQPLLHHVWSLKIHKTCDLLSI